MDAVTYPETKVRDRLNEAFVCFAVNTAEPSPSGRELARKYRLLWDPGFVFLDARGNELRRFVGYRPPRDFLAELDFVLGFMDLLYLRFDSASQHFRKAADIAASAETSAESLYWLGISEFRRTHREMSNLKVIWNELARDYPESTWTRRAEVFDVQPTGERKA